MYIIFVFYVNASGTTRPMPMLIDSEVFLRTYFNNGMMKLVDKRL